MRTLKVTLAYDGTDYAGWQLQPGKTTLQGAVEQVLERITGAPVRITASGRTDAGVHALGQVITFKTACLLPVHKLRNALNAWLPRDIAALAVEDMPPGFHATGDARRKRYRYQVDDGEVANVFLRRYAWYIPQRLDEQAMHRAAQLLVGTHDFSSFETTGSPRQNSTRTVFELTVSRRAGEGAGFLSAQSAMTEEPNGPIAIEIEADGFLYNMVRAITGTLVDVGRGAREESWPAQVLAARNRSAAGATAPAQGLMLLRVEYEPAPERKGITIPGTKLSKDLLPIYILEIERGNEVVGIGEPAGTNCPYAVTFKQPLHKSDIERELVLAASVRYWESRDPHYAIEAGYFSDESRHSVAGPLKS